MAVTDTDIQNAGPGANLKCGDGITLHVNSRGDQRCFRVRLSLGGKDTSRTLGYFPEMKLPDARIKANEYRVNIKEAREKRSTANWTEFLEANSAPSRKASGRWSHPGLGKDDIGRFICNLFAYPNPEIRLAIWLQMLIPYRSGELLYAKWNEINRQSLQWTIGRQEQTKQRNARWISAQIEYLSQSAVSAIKELDCLPDKNDFLFPNLSGLTKANRDKAIAAAIENIWPNHVIGKSTFVDLFQNMAIQYSYFRPEFIQSTIRHAEGKGAINNDINYTPQRRALAEWWGNVLNRLRSESFANRSQSEEISKLILKSTWKHQ